MRRALLILHLLALPAFAELELLASQLVSQLPDGLGPVVLADLDADGDRDLLVAGRRNDFLGWIEATGIGPAGALRPIDSGEIPVAGLRPMVANLDGGAYPDLHFPGWKVPAGFRSFGPPVPHPASAGHEFIAAHGDLIVARSLANGDWVRITATGVLPLSPDGAVLRSAASPSREQVHFGDLNDDGSLDLLAVMDGVTRNGSPVPPGLYWLPLSSSSAVPPRSITAAVPRLVAPVYDTNAPLRVRAVLTGFDRIIEDDSPPIDPPVPVTAIHLYWPGFSELSVWNSRLAIHVGPGATSLAALATTTVEDIRFEVAAPDPDYGAGSLRRYQARNSITTELGIHLLGEQGSCGIHLLGSSGARLLTFSSTEEVAGAETIRRVDAGDLLDTVPGDGLDSLPVAGRIVAGPFGTYDHATWEDFGGPPRLVAASDGCEAMLLFDGAALQAPRALSALTYPLLVPRFPGPNGPPLVGDLDGDGDTDLARTFFLSGSHTQALWENLGEDVFAVLIDLQRYPAFAADQGFAPFRVDLDPASGRSRVLSSKPGIVTSTSFSRSNNEPFPWPEIYPGLGARVVRSDRDIDGDGDADLVFFPSVFGNALAWGAWNPETRLLDSLESVSTHPAGVTVPSLKSGDLDGDGTPDLFHPSLDASGQQVTWVAGRLAAGTLTSFAHPALALPEAATRVIPLDLDNDGDMDLIRFIPDTAVPAQADGIRPHELRWSEYIGGLWVHHAEVLGRLRTSTVIPEPVLRKEAVSGGDRILVANRIGEILEIQTRSSPPSGPLATLLAADGITGASSGSEDDPDGDGIPNFAEILAGTSPVVADSGFSIPLQKLDAGSNSGWIASLPVSLAEFGIEGRLETSDTLAAWTRHDAAPSPLGMQGGRHRYLFPDPALDPSPARRFARIVFTRE